MEHVKSWVLSKCREVPRLPLDRDTTGHIHRVVVTPKNIPEFTIPRGSVSPEPGTLSPDGGGGAQDPEVGSQSSGGSQPCSLPASSHSSPRHSPTLRQASSPVFLQPPGRTVRSKSAPVSPILMLESPECFSDAPYDHQHSGVHSCDSLQLVGDDDTNADPMSLAAMSLPHFKVKTVFGFDTLTQNPHTRRRESLFHTIGADSSPTMNRTSPNRRSHKERNEGPVSPKAAPVISVDPDISDSLFRKPSCKRRNVPSLITPLGLVTHPRKGSAEDQGPVRLASPPASPQRSPEVHRRDGGSSSGETKRRSSRRNKMYFRRRSSLSGLYDTATVCPFCKQSSEDASGSGDGGSGGVSGSNARRLSSDDVTEHLSAVDVDKLRRVRSVRAPSSKDSFTRSASLYVHSQSHGSLSSGRSQRSQRSPGLCTCDYTKTKLEARLLAELGEAKLDVQHIPREQLLKVTLLRAENLGGHRTGHSINAFAKLCLTPGKQQKQVSPVVKHTRDPVFNQEFLFYGIKAEALKTTSVKVRFFHKPNNLRREELLGEVRLPLSVIGDEKETRLWRNLEPELLSEVRPPGPSFFCLVLNVGCWVLWGKRD